MLQAPRRFEAAVTTLAALVAGLEEEQPPARERLQDCRSVADAVADAEVAPFVVELW